MIYIFLQPFPRFFNGIQTDLTVYSVHCQVYLRYITRYSISCSVVDFYNRINLIVGGIEDVCNEESCPTMSGGKRLLVIVNYYRQIIIVKNRSLSESIILL